MRNQRPQDRAAVSGGKDLADIAIHQAARARPGIILAQRRAQGIGVARYPRPAIIVCQQARPGGQIGAGIEDRFRGDAEPLPEESINLASDACEGRRGKRAISSGPCPDGTRRDCPAAKQDIFDNRLLL